MDNQNSIKHQLKDKDKERGKRKEDWLKMVSEILEKIFDHYQFHIGIRYIYANPVIRVAGLLRIRCFYTLVIRGYVQAPIIIIIIVTLTDEVVSVEYEKQGKSEFKDCL